MVFTCINPQEHKTALMFAIESRSNKCIELLLLHYIATYDLIPRGDDNWVAAMVTLPAMQDKHISLIETFFEQNVDKIREWANSRDSSGRRAIDVALPKIKEAMEACMLFLRRYELKEAPP